MPNISIRIVIPAKNEAKYIDECLGALFVSLDRSGYEYDVVIVDNESTDDTVMIGLTHQCKILTSNADSIGKLRNLGAANTDANILGFLDADCLVSPDWISLCVENFLDEKVVAVGTRAIPNPLNATWVERSLCGLMAGAARADFVEWLGTSNLLVRKEDFLRVGGFEEGLKTGEDVNLCRKLRQENDFKIRLEKRIDTLHMRESRTLTELFRREFRRGRNSLRSTLASGFPLKEIPSIAVPAMNIVGMLLCLLLANSHPLQSIIFGMVCLTFPIMFILNKKKRIAFEYQLLYFYLIALVYITARSFALIYELCDCIALVKFAKKNSI